MDTERVTGTEVVVSVRHPVLLCTTLALEFNGTALPPYVKVPNRRHVAAAAIRLDGLRH
uniref:Uncharacterized protein n=1 Tax=Oryza sativa subsp. japonica TaxID=39947 RepID=Q6ZBR7_ORYSJ|nr:hypothetical protein [Oryza sativa Japonica Group]BAD09649.1 hypothetical protein [Oryza sativa Japonica Group]